MTTVIETAIAKKPDGEVFESARFELVLVRDPQRVIRDARSGEVVGKTEPVRIHFRGGRYTAQDADEVSYLKGHRLFGDPEDGFSLMPMPAPAVSQEEINAMLAAAAANDAETLQAMLEDERANWDRADVVDLLEGTLERVTAPE
jgi:hypothetical protein